jgi:hypothetical protein
MGSCIGLVLTFAYGDTHSGHSGGPDLLSTPLLANDNPEDDGGSQMNAGPWARLCPLWALFRTSDGPCQRDYSIRQLRKLQGVEDPRWHAWASVYPATPWGCDQVNELIYLFVFGFGAQLPVFVCWLPLPLPGGFVRHAELVVRWDLRLLAASRN